jgi:hypothetical protein
MRADAGGAAGGGAAGNDDLYMSVNGTSAGVLSDGAPYWKCFIDTLRTTHFQDAKTCNVKVEQ